MKWQETQLTETDDEVFFQERGADSKKKKKRLSGMFEQKNYTCHKT